MAVEDQSIGIPFPVRTPVRCPYLVQVHAALQTNVATAPVAPAVVAEEAGSVGAHKTGHVAEEPLPLDALDHIASHSSSSGRPAPAVAEGLAVLRFPLSCSIHVNRCEFSFISYYVHILK